MNESPQNNDTSKQRQSGASSRMPSLDGFRGISILLVLIGHVSETVNAPAYLATVRGFGNYGVKFFFVISGFLITTLLLNELSKYGAVSLKNFYLRRTLRIFPALYTYIIVISIMHFAGLLNLMPGDIFHAATYTMNYHHERAWYLNHTWSLAVEEQFYLLWPSLLVLLGVRRAMWVAAAALLISPLSRAYMWHVLGSCNSAMTREFQAVADSLATGCLLAGCRDWLGQQPVYLKFIRSRVFFVVCFFIFLAPALSYKLNPEHFYIWTQSLTNAGVALCIDRWVRFPGDFVGRLLNFPPLVFVGVLSYSLYLWQEPFLNPFSSAPLARFPQNLLPGVICALLSYYLVEKPFLNLKSRIEARGHARRQAATAQPGIALSLNAGCSADPAYRFPEQG